MHADEPAHVDATVLSVKAQNRSDVLSIFVVEGFRAEDKPLSEHYDVSKWSGAKLCHPAVAVGNVPAIEGDPHTGLNERVHVAEITFDILELFRELGDSWLALLIAVKLEEGRALVFRHLEAVAHIDVQLFVEIIAA